jgi:hypothetical protein
MYYTMNRACPNIVAFNGLEQVKEVTEAIKYHFKYVHVRDFSKTIGH